MNGSCSTAPEKNFGLHPEEFDTLVSQLKSGNEHLFETVFLSHFEKAVAYLTHKCGVSHDEAYDCTMETLLHFRRLLIDGKVRYGNLSYLFTKIAQQRLVRQHKRRLPTTMICDHTLESISDDVELVEEDLLLLRKAYAKLGEGCRNLLRTYYFDRRSLREVARQEGRSETAVRKQKSRCVSRLRLYFSAYNLQ